LSAPERIHVVWTHAQSCTGDTVSFLNATHPSVADLLTGFLPQASGISLDFQPTIMLPWGEEAMRAVDAAERGELDPFVLLVEGSVPNESIAAKTGGHFCLLGEDEKGNPIAFNERLDRLSKKAAAIVAVGTCASFGGVVAGRPNPTGATGVIGHLGKGWKSALGVPVINVPGCPANAEDLAETLTHLVLAVRGVLPLPELDEENRPKYLFSLTAHEQCPRAGRYASGKISKAFGEENCMGGLGCKGPISHCSVPKRGFVEGVGGCPTVGSNCIGCTMPGFPDAPFSPFMRKAPASFFVAEKAHEAWGSIKMVGGRVKSAFTGRDY